MTGEQLAELIKSLEKTKAKRLHQERLARARADAATKSAADELTRADALASEAALYSEGIEFFQDKLQSLQATADTPEVTV